MSYISGKTIDEGSLLIKHLLKRRGPSEAERLHRLEEEQEHLNNSLLALTTHFAQVN